jgi:hypothetical protein
VFIAKNVFIAKSVLIPSILVIGMMYRDEINRKHNGYCRFAGGPGVPLESAKFGPMWLCVPTMEPMPTRTQID